METETVSNASKELLETLNLVTLVGAGLILVAVIAAFVYVRSVRANDELKSKKRWIGQIPSMISTLGVLGTFIGITIGLYYFQTKDLDNSIPLLLEGLKTAFMTSLAGMFGSLVMSWYINSAFDSEEEGVSNMEDAVKQMRTEIVAGLKGLKDESKAEKEDIHQMLLLMRETNNHNAHTANATTTMKELLANKAETFDKISSRLHSIKESEASTVTLLTEQNTLLTNIGGGNAGLIEEIRSTNILLSTVAHRIRLIKETVEATDHRLGEMQDTQTAMAGIDEEINQKVGKLGNKLHEEVLEIEQSMDKTNQLLKKKFEEFAELLKKSNTEALVEVMKKVTEEFQKQMNALISKLVKENFDQLNKSVERMNKWQQENKEIIKSLTQQYKDMAQQFGQTGDTLHKVGTDTKALVGDGGKLQQIIKSLSAVLVEDKKFVEITKKLESTVELTKNNMTQFDASTKSLNEWVRKQRNFVDGVTLLINKLDELNNLRNYSEEFWKETKKGMNDGVNIIKKGSEQLNQQLTNLDVKFYERLAATLSELDACIQAMVNGNTNKNR